MVDDGGCRGTAVHARRRSATRVRRCPTCPGFELGELLARGGTSEVWAGVAVDGGRRVAVKVVHADARRARGGRPRGRGVRAGGVCARRRGRGVRAAARRAGRARHAAPARRRRSTRLVRARGHLVAGGGRHRAGPGGVGARAACTTSGVVHGDVSPGNVLLDLDGRPLLGDLGLGHVVGDVSPGVWGTEGYVAPEVLLGADPSPASDVYALGAARAGCACRARCRGAPGLRPGWPTCRWPGRGAEPLVGVLDAAVAPPTRRTGRVPTSWPGCCSRAAEPEPLELVRGGRRGQRGDLPAAGGGAAAAARAATRSGRGWPGPRPGSGAAWSPGVTADSRTEPGGAVGPTRAPAARVRAASAVLGAAAVVVALVCRPGVLAGGRPRPRGDRRVRAGASPADRVGRDARRPSRDVAGATRPATRRDRARRPTRRAHRADPRPTPSPPARAAARGARRRAGVGVARGDPGAAPRGRRAGLGRGGAGRRGGRRPGAGGAALHRSALHGRRGGDRLGDGRRGGLRARIDAGAYAVSGPRSGVTPPSDPGGRDGHRPLSVLVDRRRPCDGGRPAGRCRSDRAEPVP